MRGWSGKPFHPPLTDFPIVAYVLAAGFDIISAIGGKNDAWARELWHAATFTFIAGAAVSVLAALTGLWDARRSSEAGTQARRTINTHATIMITVTVLALLDIVWRLNGYHTNRSPRLGRRLVIRDRLLCRWRRSEGRSLTTASTSRAGVRPLAQVRNGRPGQHDNTEPGGRPAPTVRRGESQPVARRP